LRYLKLILMSAILVLSGCPVSVVYTIYNNTRKDIVVELKDDEQMVWVPGAPLYIDSDIQSRLKWVDEGGSHFPILMIRQGEKVAVYSFTSPKYPIPEEYVAKSPGKAREYRFQLHEDGNLYIMKPEESYPARFIRFQPPGFPMRKDNIGD
jgi:hypothetical protein